MRKKEKSTRDALKIKLWNQKSENEWKKKASNFSLFRHCRRKMWKCWSVHISDYMMMSVRRDELLFQSLIRLTEQQRRNITIAKWKKSSSWRHERSLSALLLTNNEFQMRSYMYSCCMGFWYTLLCGFPFPSVAHIAPNLIRNRDKLALERTRELESFPWAFSDFSRLPVGEKLPTIWIWPKIIFHHSMHPLSFPLCCFYFRANQTKNIFCVGKFKA